MSFDRGDCPKSFLEMEFDQFLRPSYHESEPEFVAALFEEYQITPQSHPRAVELFAGDAPHAAIMTRLGWRARDIVCIDYRRSRDPLVRGVQWRYYDLHHLSLALMVDGEIPGSILSLRQQGDVVIAINQWWRSKETLDQLVNFFCRRGGLAYTHRDVRIRS
ncbi:hypothetical protein ACFLZP_04610 [Patescibacteria group bacterium]